MSDYAVLVTAAVIRALLIAALHESHEFILIEVGITVVLIVVLVVYVIGTKLTADTHDILLLKMPVGAKHVPLAHSALSDKVHFRFACRRNPSGLLLRTRLLPAYVIAVLVLAGIEETSLLGASLNNLTSAVRTLHAGFL